MLWRKKNQGRRAGEIGAGRDHTEKDHLSRYHQDLTLSKDLEGDESQSWRYFIIFFTWSSTEHKIGVIFTMLGECVTIIIPAVQERIQYIVHHGYWRTVHNFQIVVPTSAATVFWGLVRNAQSQAPHPSIGLVLQLNCRVLLREATGKEGMPVWRLWTEHSCVLRKSKEESSREVKRVTGKARRVWGTSVTLILLCKNGKFLHDFEQQSMF